ncbi:MAG TPA: RdgB/HAM1 family non-canonical purine NTP pyrophosphatase [Abditibacteriaceae bacterium]|jgi:XTP/dITP diphosphohydrolase
MKLLLATANPHKIREIEELLADSPVELISLREFPNLQMPEETGTTMAANAQLKAVHCARETGLPALADDSGIEVDFLNGEPGVYSARWVEGADEDRTLALLSRLAGVPDELRGARYRCVICVASPGGTILESEAVCEGRIAHIPQGQNGFGYDPIFEITSATGTAPEEIGKTMAQVPPEVKAQVSHRARALQKMLATLRNCRFQI